MASIVDWVKEGFLELTRSHLFAIALIGGHAAVWIEMVMWVGIFSNWFSRDRWQQEGSRSGLVACAAISMSIIVWGVANGACADPIPGFYNTGVTKKEIALGDGSIEQHYSIISQPGICDITGC